MGSSASSAEEKTQAIVPRTSCHEYVIKVVFELKNRSFLKDGVCQLKEFPLSVKLTDTVDSVKCMILYNAGISNTSEWGLMYRGNLLNCSDTLGILSIQSNDKLVLVDGCFQVLVEEQVGKTMPIIVNELETVDALKKKIQVETKIPIKEQLLRFGCRQLDGPEILANYGIQKMSTILLRIRGVGGMSNIGFRFNSLNEIEKRNLNSVQEALITEQSAED